MPFVKGQSGNPTGRRPKSAIERRAELRAKRLSNKAFDSLERNLNCDDERKNASIEIAAAKEILDRAWGKPKDSTDVHLSGDLKTAVEVRYVRSNTAG